MAGGVIFGDLYNTKAITSADLDAAIDAFLADPTLTHLTIGECHAVDLAAAVASSLFAAEILADPDLGDRWKRRAVRTAILMARPVKG